MRAAPSPGPSSSPWARSSIANGGTLFLDEIGDLPLALQAKLLRFLQERVIERIGGRQEIPVDVRVVCATHHDLDELMRGGHVPRGPLLPAGRDRRASSRRCASAPAMRCSWPSISSPSLPGSSRRTRRSPPTHCRRSMPIMARQCPRAAEPGEARGHHGRRPEITARNLDLPGAGACRRPEPAPPPRRRWRPSCTGAGAKRRQPFRRGAALGREPAHPLRPDAAARPARADAAGQLAPTIAAVSMTS